MAQPRIAQHDERGLGGDDVVGEFVRGPRRCESVIVDVHAYAHCRLRARPRYLLTSPVPRRRARAGTQRQGELSGKESGAFGCPCLVCVVEEALPVVREYLAGG